MDTSHGPTAVITIPGLVLSTWSGTQAAQDYMFHRGVGSNEDADSLRLAKQIEDAPEKRAGRWGTYKRVTMDKETMAALTDYLEAWSIGARDSEEYSEVAAINTTLGRLAAAKRTLA